MLVQDAHLTFSAELRNPALRCLQPSDGQKWVGRTAFSLWSAYLYFHYEKC